MKCSFITLIGKSESCGKARPFLFGGLRYLPIWKIEIWKKTKKKNDLGTNCQQISKYKAYFSSAEKTLMLICHILNIYNYKKVLFGYLNISIW